MPNFPRSNLIATVLVLLCLFSSAANDAGARTILRGKPADWYLAADLVLDVKVLSKEKLAVKGQECGTKTVAEVLRVQKGSLQTKVISFGRRPNLTEGLHYRVYLRRVNSPEEIIARMKEQGVPIDVSEERLEELVICKELVPGFEYFEWIQRGT